MTPAMLNPKPPHASLPDLQAIDAMITAARDHAAAIIDAAAPGTVLKSKARTLLRQLELASTECTWLSIDLDPQLRAAAAPARPSFTERATQNSEPEATAEAA